MWEPPGRRRCEPGEDVRSGRRARELRRRPAWWPARSAGPAMVARDYRWAGRRIVCEDAVFLASWAAEPRA